MHVTFPNIETTPQIVVMCRMASTIWNETYKDLLPREQIDYMLDMFFTPEIIKNQIARERYTYRFINADGVLEGFFGTCPRLEGDSLFLSKIYLLEKARGKGLFRAAMHDIVRQAGSHGLASIRLHVNKNNLRAINAYIRFGFRITESDVFDIGRGYVMDDHIMEYEIGPGMDS